MYINDLFNESNEMGTPEFQAALLAMKKRAAQEPPVDLKRLRQRMDAAERAEQAREKRNQERRATVDENAWSDGSNSWSSEHDQWTKENSNNPMPVDSASAIPGRVREGAGVFNIGDQVLYKGQPAEVLAVDGTAATVYVPNWKAVPGMVDDTMEVDPASKFLNPMDPGVAEGSLEEIDRRGFLKGMGAAAVAGAAGGAEATDFTTIPNNDVPFDRAKERLQTRFIVDNVLVLYYFLKKHKPNDPLIKEIQTEIKTFLQKHPENKDNVNRSWATTDNMFTQFQNENPRGYERRMQEVFTNAKGIINQFKNLSEFNESVEQGVAEEAKEKTPGVALSKAYRKDFDGKKPGQDRSETALTGAYSKTGKPGGALKKAGVGESTLTANTPDPIVVVQDRKGNILDTVNLSAAVQKYRLGNAQNIKNQLAHQNYTTIGNYVVMAPMGGQPQDKTTQGVAENTNYWHKLQAERNTRINSLITELKESIK